MPAHPPSDEPDLDFGPTLRGLREGLKVFGRYELARMLGRGGMGVVWLARDTKLDLQMALKFLPENLVHDEVALDDLRRETRRCLKLTHQNIVHVFDLVDDEATAAIAMEYVEGKTLSALRLEKPNRVFEPADILPWLQQVCEALEYAHTKAKIVHHDLKPGNLMLSSEGEVKVMDFGIASSLGDSMSRVSKAGRQSSGGGTLPYMSPQQLMGFPPSVSDDVYSLGATIYELLTGKPPFFRGSLESQIQTLMPPSIAERRMELNVMDAFIIPEAWEQLIAHCLAKESEKRPPGAMAVWRSLGRETVFTSGPSTNEIVLPPPPVDVLQRLRSSYDPESAVLPPPPILPSKIRPKFKEAHLDTRDRTSGNKHLIWNKLRHWCLWWALGHALVVGLVCGLASLIESVTRNSVTVEIAAPAPAEETPADRGWYFKPPITPSPAAAPPPAAGEEATAKEAQWDKNTLGRIGILILKNDPGSGIFLFISGLLGCLLLPVLHYLVLRPYYPLAARFATATAVTVFVASIFIMLLADQASFRAVRTESYYAWYGLIDDWIKLPLFALSSSAVYDFVFIKSSIKIRWMWFVTHVLGLVISGIALGAAVHLMLPDPIFPVTSMNATYNPSNAECFGLDFMAGATQGLIYGILTAISWAILETQSSMPRQAASSPN